MTVTSPAGLLKIMSEFGREIPSTVISTVGSSNFTAPTGTRLVVAEVWGGGGGGGAGTTGNWPYNPSGEPLFGPGGGGGGYNCGIYTVSGSTTVSYTVGGGGSGQVQPNSGGATNSPRAGSGGTSSVTINGVTTQATGGQGAVSWLTEGDPIGNPGVENVFNQEVGSGGTPKGNPGNLGGIDQTPPSGEGGEELSSSYTVNGLFAWFDGTYSAGEGGRGAVGNGSGFFSAGQNGFGGLVVIYFIGDVDPNRLTDFYSGGTYVPNASPNTGIATTGNILISTFVNSALVPAYDPDDVPDPDPTPPPSTTLTVINNPVSYTVDFNQNPTGTPFNITANASGGSGSYTYSWTVVPTNDITLTNTTQQTVTVDVDSTAIGFSYTITCTVNDGVNTATGDTALTVAGTPL
jgi:hypothetical protein